MRRIAALAAATLACSVLLPVAVGNAAAGQGDITAVGKPDTVHKLQRMTVTVWGASPETYYVTYREILASKLASSHCASTMATNVDARLYGPVASRVRYQGTKVLKLQLHLVCVYRAPGGSLDPAKARLSSTAKLGQWFVGAPLTPTKTTKVTAKATRSGRTEVLTGTTNGPSTVVVVQVKSGGIWRVVTSTPVKAHRYTAKVPAVSGQLVRVLLLPTDGYKAAATAAIRVH